MAPQGRSGALQGPPASVRLSSPAQGAAPAAGTQMSTAGTAAAAALQQQFKHRAASLAAKLKALQKSQLQQQRQHTGRDGMGRTVPTTVQAPQTVQQSRRPGQVRRKRRLPHQVPPDLPDPSQTAPLLLTKHHPSTVQARVPKGSTAGQQPAAEGIQPNSMQLGFSTPASAPGPAPKPAVIRLALRPASTLLRVAQQQQQQPQQKQQQAQWLPEPTLMNSGHQQQGQQDGDQLMQDLLPDYLSSDDDMSDLEAQQQLPNSLTGPSAAAGSMLAHSDSMATQAQQAPPLTMQLQGRTTQPQDLQHLQPTAQQEALGSSPKRRRLVGPPSAGGACPAVGWGGQGPGSTTGMQGPSSSLGLPQLQINQPSEAQATFAAMQAAMSAATSKATTAVLECLAEEAAQAALACRAGRSSHQVAQQPVTVTVAPAARVRLLASLASPAVDAVASLTPASAGKLRNLPVCGRGQTAASMQGLRGADWGMTSYADLAGIAAAVEPAWARAQLLAAAQAAVSQPQYGLRGWFLSGQHLLQQLLATDLQLEVDDSNKWSAGPWLQHVVSAIVHLAEALYSALQVLQPSTAQPNTSAAAAAAAAVTAAAEAAAGFAVPSQLTHSHTLLVSSTGTAAGAPVPPQAASTPPAAAVKQQGALLPSVPQAFATQAPAAAGSAAVPAAKAGSAAVPAAKAGSAAVPAAKAGSAAAPAAKAGSAAQAPAAKAGSAAAPAAKAGSAAQAPAAKAGSAAAPAAKAGSAAQAPAAKAGSAAQAPAAKTGSATAPAAKAGSAAAPAAKAGSATAPAAKAGSAAQAPAAKAGSAAQAPAAKAGSAAAKGSLHADQPGAGHSSLQLALGFNPDGVLVSAEGTAAAEAALSSAVQRAAAELTAARMEAGVTPAAGRQPAGDGLDQAVPQGLGAKHAAAHAGVRVPGSILSPLVRLMVPGLPELLALSRGTAGPISNAAVRVDQDQAAHGRALGQVAEEQLLTLSGLQAACFYVTLPELQQQLLRFAIGAAGADGLPWNGLAGWLWNAHWMLQQRLEGHTQLPAVGSLQEQLQAAVGSLVNLSRLLLLALSMLQRGRAAGAVTGMMLPAPAAVTATAAAAAAKTATAAAAAAAPAGEAAGAAAAATVKAAAAQHGHQQHRPQAALVHALTPIQVLQLPPPDDADNQIMADIAAVVAAAQQTAEASYDPQQPRYNKGAGGRYSSWPELTHPATVWSLLVGVMPQAAALAALAAQDLVPHLRTCPISSTVAVQQKAPSSIAGVVLTEGPGLQAAVRLIGGHRPLQRQLGKALEAAMAPAGDGLRGFFSAALGLFKEEWQVGAVLHPQQSQHTAGCVQSTVLCKVRFAHLLVRILHLLLPHNEEQRPPAAAAAAAAAAAEQGDVQGHLLRRQQQQPPAAVLPRKKLKAVNKRKAAQPQQPQVQIEHEGVVQQQQQPQVKIEQEGVVQQQQQLLQHTGAVGATAGPPEDTQVKVKVEPSRLHCCCWL